VIIEQARQQVFVEIAPVGHDERMFEEANDQWRMIGA